MQETITALREINISKMWCSPNIMERNEEIKIDFIKGWRANWIHEMMQALSPEYFFFQTAVSDKKFETYRIIILRCIRILHGWKNWSLTLREDLKLGEILASKRSNKRQTKHISRFVLLTGCLGWSNEGGRNNWGTWHVGGGGIIEMQYTKRFAGKSENKKHNWMIWT